MAMSSKLIINRINPLFCGSSRLSFEVQLSNYCSFLKLKGVVL